MLWEEPMKVYAINNNNDNDNKKKNCWNLLRDFLDMATKGKP